MTKSFLKWAGGKFKILEFLIDAIGKVDGRFVEPFVGSGVVSLNVEADSYLLADSNNDLINLFRTLKKYGKEFIDYCEAVFRNGNRKEIYYYNRDLFNSLPFNYQRAALFLYLNRHCYNGLCRYNSFGGFNVPYGKYKQIYFPKDEMLTFLDKASKFEFKCQDFRETFSELSPTDVVYCDPPYIPLNIMGFTDYTKDGFSMKDQMDLAYLANNALCKVFISNHWIPGITDRLYRGANLDRQFSVRRYISAYDKVRPQVKEVLAEYR